MTDGGAACRATAGASVPGMDSRVRGNDGRRGGLLGHGGRQYRGWIPAFAGMTDGGAACWATGVVWIPAFAGMTDGGVGQGTTGRS